MTASVAIRLATLSDAIALTDLSIETFYDTFSDSTSAEDMTAYLAAAFSVAQLQAELSDPRSTFWLAEAGDRLVGYAKLRQKRSVPDAIDGHSPLELQRLYVRRNCLRQGVGSALMQACLDAAKSASHQTLWLGVWERNDRAQAFYQRWGFERVGQQEFAMGVEVQTDWLMARAL